MRKVTRFRWDMNSETVPGRRVHSREHMTADEALAIDRTAQPLWWSKEEKWVTDAPDVPAAFDPYDPRWTT